MKKRIASKDKELLQKAIYSIGIAHENLIEMDEQTGKVSVGIKEAEGLLVRALNVLDHIDKGAK